MKTAMIIGGGIAGCSTAYALAQSGFKVTLLERHPTLATEASGNPLAVLYPRLTGQDTALEQLNVQGYRHSLQLLHALGLDTLGSAALSQDGCQYLACGVVQLMMEPTSNHKLAALMHAYAQSGLFEVLKAAALSQRCGIAVQHPGLYFPQAGGVNLPKLCQVLVEDIAENIKVLPCHTAIKIERASQWQVIAADGRRLSADVLVIANANDASQLSQAQHIPLTAVRGQLSYLKKNEESAPLNTIVCGDGYITPAIDGLHYLGASFSQQDDDASVRSADHESNLQLLKNISPDLYQALQNQVVAGRVAWRSQTPDYLPAAGQLLDAEALRAGKFYYNDTPDKLPWLPGLYINTGHGSKGFLSAPLCAQVIADHAAGKTSKLPTTLLNALQPNRFILRKLGLKLLAQHLIH